MDSFNSSLPFRLILPLTLGILLAIGILGLLWCIRNYQRRGMIDRIKARRELRAARRKIQVLEESFERRVEEATQESRQTVQQLRNIADLKDGFLTAVSHELRTPLTSIRSFAEILLESWYEETDQTRTEFLTIICDESKRICRLINQILDLEKIESGSMDWHLQSFDLLELGQKTLKVQGGFQRIKAVQYELVAPQGPVLFCGDEDRLQQVLVNLLSNAWKHSPAGGLIRLVIEEFAGGVEIRVQDEGPGIPDDGTREAIFQKYYQAGDSKEPAMASTGLGLAITKEIVQMHGGWISCEDGELCGASFVLLLPHDEVRLELQGGAARSVRRAVMLPASPAAGRRGGA